MPPHPQILDDKFKDRDTRVRVRVQVLQHFELLCDISYDYELPRLLSISPSSGAYLGGDNVFFTGVHLGVEGNYDLVPLVFFDKYPGNHFLDFFL